MLPFPLPTIFQATKQIKFAKTCDTNSIKKSNLLTFRHHFLPLPPWCQGHCMWSWEPKLWLKWEFPYFNSLFLFPTTFPATKQHKLSNSNKNPQLATPKKKQKQPTTKRKKKTGKHTSWFNSTKSSLLTSLHFSL